MRFSERSGSLVPKDVIDAVFVYALEKELPKHCLLTNEKKGDAEPEKTKRTSSGKKCSICKKGRDVSTKCTNFMCKSRCQQQIAICSYKDHPKSK